MADLISQSDALHERVQAFIAAPASSGESFERLALDIAEYQARAIPAYARLVRAHGARLDAVETIPAVPVETFRITRVAAHPPELDRVRFLTSGTTSGDRGQHCMRRTDTYRAAAIAWGRPALVPSDRVGATVLCLAPRPEGPPSSSLAFMMQAFGEAFDPSWAECQGKRWFSSEAGLDLPGFRATLDSSLAACRPTLVLATSFALVYLLDALGGETLPSNGQAIVMQTGGFKGKSREVAPDELRREVARSFGIEPHRIVGEYGMTELSSQLYEDSLRSKTIGSPTGWYVPPPWLRIDALDPVRMVPVPEGEVGLACFFDLANVDSAVRILTADRIVCRGRAIRLLGRDVAAGARGCSLADEELLGG